jgi:hypothetical protein
MCAALTRLFSVLNLFIWRLCSDSTLVTRQMRGEWGCTAPGLVPLRAAAAAAARAFDAVDFAYIPRAQNARVRPSRNHAPAAVLVLSVICVILSFLCRSSRPIRRMRWPTGRWTRARRASASTGCSWRAWWPARREG